VGPARQLVQAAVRQALARQAALRRRRETYVGPRLPEPLVTDLPDAPAPGPAGAADADDAAVRAEAVSVALLVVLETLTPLERAVFVLGEVFGYAHPEIAAILGRRPAAIRQLAHRAHAHVRARRRASSRATLAAHSFRHPRRAGRPSKRWTRPPRRARQNRSKARATRSRSSPSASPAAAGTRRIQASTKRP
jgi:hypothetical protein